MWREQLLSFRGETILLKYRGKSMSKTVRLDEDAYFALKARASREGKTLSGVVYALMYTADEQASTEKRISSLETQIQELKSLIFQIPSSSTADIKNKAPESGFEPESEPRQGLTGTSRPSATQHSCVSP